MHAIIVCFPVVFNLRLVLHKAVSGYSCVTGVKAVNDDTECYRYISVLIFSFIVHISYKCSTLLVV